MKNLIVLLTFLLGTLDELMLKYKINEELRYKIVRGFLTSVVYSFSLYGSYLRASSNDEFDEKYSLRDIDFFRPIPVLFDCPAYYIIGTDYILVADEKYTFLKLSYCLDDDYITIITLEELLEDIPSDIGSAIIFNLDRLN